MVTSFHLPQYSSRCLFHYAGKATSQHQFQSLDASYIVVRNHVHMQWRKHVNALVLIRKENGSYGPQRISALVIEKAIFSSKLGLLTSPFKTKRKINIYNVYKLSIKTGTDLDQTIILSILFKIPSYQGIHYYQGILQKMLWWGIYWLVLSSWYKLELSGKRPLNWENVSIKLPVCRALSWLTIYW